MNDLAVRALREAIRPYMDERRYRHTLGVEKEMRYLASSLAPALTVKASVAALLHDITKCRSHEEQISFCEENGIPVLPEDLRSPPLLHAKTGVCFAKKHFSDLFTEDIAAAIASHTTGASPLSLLGAMLFVADFTEEGRSFPDCLTLRAFLHSRPIDGADGMTHFKEVLLRCLRFTIDELLREEKPIAPATVITYNTVLAGETLF